MTLIEISGSKNFLNQINAELQTLQHFPNIKTKLSEYHTDSIDSNGIETILALVFSGTIACSQVINVIMAIQKKRNENSKSQINLAGESINITIETIHGKKVELIVSENMTKTDIQRNQKSLQSFLEQCSGKIDYISIDSKEKLQIILKELSNKINDIRVKERTPNKHYDDGSFSIGSEFKSSNFSELILSSKTKEIYLNTDEVQSCKDLFFFLEKENILSFHEMKYDFHTLDLQTIFVRYEVEKLRGFTELMGVNPFLFD